MVHAKQAERLRCTDVGTLLCHMQIIFPLRDNPVRRTCFLGVVALFAVTERGAESFRFLGFQVRRLQMNEGMRFHSQFGKTLQGGGGRHYECLVKVNTGGCARWPCLSYFSAAAVIV